MTREEALIKFEKEDANELLQKYEIIFCEDVIKNKDLLKDTIINSLKEICEKVKELEDYKIAYFQFSILRTSIMSKTYKMLLSTYNEDWYLDDNQNYIEIDMSYIYNSLNELYNELYEKSKKFIGKINKCDIFKIVLKQAISYNEHIAHAIRFILQDIDENQWFQDVEKTDRYFIRWGEYQDKSELVYAMDVNKKTTNDFIKALDKVDKEKNEEDLVYSVWKDSEISDIICSQKNMMFANFKNSKISNCAFKESILIGTNFENSNLKNVDFTKSNLAGANFINAKLQNVKFEDAILDGAVFSQKDVAFLHLSSSQLQVIYIKGD